MRSLGPKTRIAWTDPPRWYAGTIDFLQPLHACTLFHVGLPYVTTLQACHELPQGLSVRRCRETQWEYPGTAILYPTPFLFYFLVLRLL